MLRGVSFLGTTIFLVLRFSITKLADYCVLLLVLLLMLFTFFVTNEYSFI